ELALCGGIVRKTVASIRQDGGKAAVWKWARRAHTFAKQPENGLPCRLRRNVRMPHSCEDGSCVHARSRVWDVDPSRSSVIQAQGRQEPRGLLALGFRR